MKSTVCRAYTRACAFAAFSRHPDAGTVISFARRTHTPTYCSQTSESATERWSALGVKVNTHRRSPSPDQGTLSSQISTYVSPTGRFPASTDVPRLYQRPTVRCNEVYTRNSLLPRKNTNERPILLVPVLRYPVHQPRFGHSSWRHAVAVAARDQP